MKEWIISDTHFSHAKIIEYCNRPFRDVEQMNEIIIARWKNTVKPEDIVYHLGDVGYLKGNQFNKTEPTAIQKIVSQLPGKKILIRGNHDKSPNVMQAVGFDFVVDELVISYEGMLIQMTHRPQTVRGFSPMTVPPSRVHWVLHGHIHNSTPEHRAKHIAKGEIVEIPDWNVNMCVEMWNYTPVSLRGLVKQLRQRMSDKNRQQEIT